MESRRELQTAVHGGVLGLDLADLLEILPHRPPMLLVDRVLSLVPGQHAVGTKTVTGNEFGLSRRRVGFVFPSTLAFEALGQLAAVALLYEHQSGRPSPSEEPHADSEPTVLLTGVEHLEVHREALPGDVLQMSIDILRARRGMHQIQGRIAISGQPYLVATFGALVNMP